MPRCAGARLPSGVFEVLTNMPRSFVFRRWGRSPGAVGASRPQTVKTCCLSSYRSALHSRRFERVGPRYRNGRRSRPVSSWVCVLFHVQEGQLCQSQVVPLSLGRLAEHTPGRTQHRGHGRWRILRLRRHPEQAPPHVLPRGRADLPGPPEVRLAMPAARRVQEHQVARECHASWKLPAAVLARSAAIQHFSKH